MRYRLDDLGWFHFEKLVQSLLKANLGLAVQSWGGHSDLGRDAYTRTRLTFPNPSVPSDGPFIFQAKFIQGANSAGAKWRPLLVKAIKREVESIQERRDENKWKEPAHYILLTNAPLTANSRQEIENTLVKELPSSEITTLGGSDICDIIDKHPELRRSFPEILSLRDLNILLTEAVNKQILQRSWAALKESRDLVPVFVPTKAYYMAWTSIQKHFFVVLDGPPEMGKTSIAWTIALGHLLSDWEVIECRDPGEFFASFTHQRQQVFVADDAFGRTEYDPYLGRMWERDLPRVFQCLDSHHHFIWTTRKHILIRALREMDLTNRASQFPDLGEVIVTAEELSQEEKARILYRHSKAARLDNASRELVKNNAVEIVEHAHFTPERIRRFIVELLPELLTKSGAEPLTQEALTEEIVTAIQDPTDRMRKSFRKLDEIHKWILISFLECDYSEEYEVLGARFACHQPLVSSQKFSEMLDDLLGTFLKPEYRPKRLPNRRGNWIHPSYRDLVVDELSADPVYRKSFLEHSSIRGIKLALSQAGGSSGQRQMPLMTTPEDWEIFEQRCHKIANNGDDTELNQLIVLLSGSLSTDESQPMQVPPKIENILRSVCKVCVARWNKQEKPLHYWLVESLLRASGQLSPSPPLPNIEVSWKTSCSEVLREIDRNYVSNPSIVNNWINFSNLIKRYYQKLSISIEFLDCRTEIENRLFELAEEEVENDSSLEDSDSNNEEGSRLMQFARVLSRLDSNGNRTKVISDLTSLSEYYFEEGTFEPDYDRDLYGERDYSEDFDIQELFEDL